MANSDTRTTYIVEGIECFFAGIAVINPGDGFIDNMLDAIGSEMVVEFNHHAANGGGGGVGGGEQAAVGESLVTVKGGADNIGGEKGTKMAFLVNHQRGIDETVGVVVHVAAVEKECAVDGPCYEGVPRFGLFAAVSYDCVHAAYFRNSSYSRI